MDFKTKNDVIEENILYKYINIDINSLNLILNNKARLSDYNYFNNPADPPLKLNIKSFEYISSYINSIKICSLSSEYKNFLMWSHYANLHKGICIAYDISNINKYDKTILKKLNMTVK